MRQMSGMGRDSVISIVSALAVSARWDSSSTTSMEKDSSASWVGETFTDTSSGVPAVRQWSTAARHSSSMKRPARGSGPCFSARGMNIVRRARRAPVSRLQRHSPRPPTILPVATSTAAGRPRRHRRCAERPRKVGRERVVRSSMALSQPVRRATTMAPRSVRTAYSTPLSIRIATRSERRLRSHMGDRSRARPAVELRRSSGPAVTSDVLRRNNVIVTGNPAGRALVFAHGFGCSQAAWNLVAPQFEAEYRVVLFDHVGAGRLRPHRIRPRQVRLAARLRRRPPRDPRGRRLQESSSSATPSAR